MMGTPTSDPQLGQIFIEKQFWEVFGLRREDLADLTPLEYENRLIVLQLMAAKAKQPP